MCLTYVQYYIYKRRGIEMFSLLFFSACVCSFCMRLGVCVCVSVFVCMCWEGYFCVCVCVCLSFSFRVFCFCRFMFWCIVRFSSFDCVFAFFVFFFFSFCVCVFCFQFSLPITKYFVCLFVFAYNWMFCLRALALVRLNKSVGFVSDFFCLLCGWCLLLWPSLSLSLGWRWCVHCLCFCVCLFDVGVVVYSFSLI